MALDRTAYNALVNDDGTNLVGTVIDKNLIKTVVLDPVDVALAALAAADALKATLAAPALTGVPTAPTAAPGTNTTQLATTAFVAAFVPPPVVQTTTLTGTQNDFALTASGAILRCNNATLLTLNGLAAGVDGQRLTIRSVGAGQVNLASQAAGSTAANRLITPADPYSAPLAAGVGSADLRYDATTARWIVTQHTQGAPIAIPYTAGDFTAVGGGTWTVDAGDLQVFNYTMVGRLVVVNLVIYTSSVSATPTNLKVTLPWTPVTFYGPLTLLDNSARVSGYFSNTTLAMLINRQDAGLFAISVNNTWILGQAVFSV